MSIDRPPEILVAGILCKTGQGEGEQILRHKHEDGPALLLATRRVAIIATGGVAIPTLFGHYGWSLNPLRRLSLTCQV